MSCPRAGEIRARKTRRRVVNYTNTFRSFQICSETYHFVISSCAVHILTAKTIPTCWQIPTDNTVNILNFNIPSHTLLTIHNVALRLYLADFSPSIEVQYNNS
jgi:hypothetical protein